MDQQQTRSASGATAELEIDTEQPGKQTLPSSLKLPPNIAQQLACPVCHARLVLAEQQCVCTNAQCGAMFPIVGGVPILLNEHTSLFSIEDASRQCAGYRRPARGSLLKRLIPGNSKNIKSKANAKRLVKLLLERTERPSVLIVGGRKLGDGMEPLLHPKIQLIASDVSPGPRTALICDAHDIPFEAATFDSVVIQAVLEHVADPYRCVDEIHRVLKPEGYVYAETPFIQQVHGADYGDFTRFTYAGHRRLFRRFSGVDSGMACGPGMALTWTLEYFLLSFVSTKRMKSIVRTCTRVAFFYLKYLDYYLIDKPGALGAASGYYFLGRKSDHTLSDQELMALLHT